VFELVPQGATVVVKSGQDFEIAEVTVACKPHLGDKKFVLDFGASFVNVFVKPSNRELIQIISEAVTSDNQPFGDNKWSYIPFVWSILRLNRYMAARKFITHFFVELWSSILQQLTSPAELWKFVDQFMFVSFCLIF
jgi:hypothetical protein